jgi:hypothetical protein
MRAADAVLYRLVRINGILRETACLRMTASADNQARLSQRTHKSHTAQNVTRENSAALVLTAQASIDQCWACAEPDTSAQSRDPHTARTHTAHRENPACGHCAPALRAALLACPDAQRALLQSVPDLTPPSWNRGGEVRNSSKARPVSPAGQNQRSRSRSRSNPYRRPAASICHAPRGTRWHWPAISGGTSGQAHRNRGSVAAREAVANPLDDNP